MFYVPKFYDTKRETDYDTLMAGFEKHGIDASKYYWYSDLVGLFVRPVPSRNTNFIIYLLFFIRNLAQVWNNATRRLWSWPGTFYLVKQFNCVFWYIFLLLFSVGYWIKIIFAMFACFHVSWIVASLKTYLPSDFCFVVNFNNDFNLWLIYWSLVVGVQLKRIYWSLKF